VTNPVLQRDIGELQLELDERPYSARPAALRPDSWIKPAELWVTVTPVMLPRRFSSLEEAVARACKEGGYPEPADVRASFAPVLAGVPHSLSFFVRPPQDGRPPRSLTHAAIRFAEPIRGPLLIGAGRSNGFGYCRPLPEDNTP